MISTTHLAFADESQYNIGRFRGVGVVSLPKEREFNITKMLDAALMESQVTELRWKKVKTARDRFAAIKVIDLCMKETLKGYFRVDILIWDTTDSRHKILRRDDNANLQRMYFHLFKTVLKYRWSNNSTWQLFPDENSAIDWTELQRHLVRKGTSIRPTTLFESGLLTLRTDYQVLGITEAKSVTTRLVQVADLFVGLGVFSHEYFETFQSWKLCHQSQPELFMQNRIQSFTPKEDEHCLVLDYFDRLCKKSRMGVSLMSYHGLRTLDPKKPFNFWCYEPQHENDKAPVRVGQND